MKTLLAVCITLIGPRLAMSAEGDRPGSRFVPSDFAHTYSIIAFDSATGEFGAAVQSHWFRVADVIWAEPGVGVVATQSLVDFAYGPVGLSLMRNGRNASQALEGLLASDPQRAVRQVAMIDSRGNLSQHTGARCIDEAGHTHGRAGSVIFACQANLMERNTVWPAMARAFSASTGPLARRLYVALEAAEAEGGDIRGRQSAALFVTASRSNGQIWRDRTIDLRVDDSPEPLRELARLLNVAFAYDHMNKGDDFTAVNDLVSANREYGVAASLQPANAEVLYWQAVTLVTTGHVDDALPVFASAFKIEPRWRALTPRLVKAELLPDDSVLIARILSQ